MTRLDWGMGDTYIESLRFTMSNGDVSPKFGRKAISHFCNFEEKLTKIALGTRDRRLVKLVFYCGED